jgi:hypothetical protein
VNIGACSVITSTQAVNSTTGSGSASCGGGETVMGWSYYVSNGATASQVGITQAQYTTTGTVGSPGSYPTGVTVSVRRVGGTGAFNLNIQLFCCPG